jgi:hypothetical protein
MAKVLVSTTDTLAMHRVEEFASTQGVSSKGMPMISSTTLTVLDMLRRVGVVPAVEIDGERAAEAVAEVLAIYRAGAKHAPSRMAGLKDVWPALHEALEYLDVAYTDAARPVSDPLLDILKETTPDA